MSYAAKTTVAADRTMEEVKSLLRRRGADRIATLEQPGRMEICFEHDRIAYRLAVVLPSPDDDQFVRHSRGSRTATAAADTGSSRCDPRSSATSSWQGGQTIAERHADDMPHHLAAGSLAALPTSGGGER